MVDRGREAYIRKGLLDKGIRGLYAAIWKYILFYKGKQKPPDTYLQMLCLITKLRTVRHKWFKIHACSIQIQRIILKVKWNGSIYFLRVRNCLDLDNLNMNIFPVISELNSQAYWHPWLLPRSQRGGWVAVILALSLIKLLLLLANFHTVSLCPKW